MEVSSIRLQMNARLIYKPLPISYCFATTGDKRYIRCRAECSGRSVPMKQITYVFKCLLMQGFKSQNEYLELTPLVGYEPADLTVHPLPRTAEGGFIFFV